MDSIAEVTTPYGEVLYRFDDENRQDIEGMEAILGELADEGLVCAVEFHTSQ